MEPAPPAFDTTNVVTIVTNADWLQMLLDRVQKDFNEFAEGPYRVYHARATEIEKFPSTVVAWIREEAQRTGLDVHCGDAFCHPCISIRKSLAVGDVMVKCY